MKPPPTIIPSTYRLYKRLERHSRMQPTGLFWEAFAALTGGSAKAAEEILHQAYFPLPGQSQLSPRKELVIDLSNKRFSPPDLVSWPEVFAAAGWSKQIQHLCHEGQIQPIHAAHLTIEIDPRPLQCNLVTVSLEELSQLQILYKIEQELVKGSALATPRLTVWFRKRNLRIEKYASMVETLDAVSSAVKQMGNKST